MARVPFLHDVSFRGIETFRGSGSRPLCTTDNIRITPSHDGRLKTCPYPTSCGVKCLPSVSISVFLIPRGLRTFSFILRREFTSTPRASLAVSTSSLASAGRLRYRIDSTGVVALTALAFLNTSDIIGYDLGRPTSTSTRSLSASLIHLHHIFPPYSPSPHIDSTNYTTRNNPRPPQPIISTLQGSSLP